MKWGFVMVSSFFLKVFKGVGRRVSRPINAILIKMYQKKAINPNLIIFESEGDLSDNAFALFYYLYQNELLCNYKVVWLVDDVMNAKRKGYKDIEFVIKWPYKIEFRRDRYLATCGIYIFDHCNLLGDYKKRSEQKIVFLTHGGFLKKTKEGENLSMFSNVDEIYVTGEIFKKVTLDLSGLTNESVKALGFPRIDYLFKDNSKYLDNFIKKLSLSQYDKVFLWMPTYRKSTSAVISENYYYTDTGLPLLKTENDIISFNEFLKSLNSICIFKIHHLQINMPCFDKSYSNLLIISDDFLQNNNVQLYELIKVSDALITDFSSVGFDYMICKKPIIYATDDFADYSNSRGFLFDISMCMAGYHCDSIETFFDSVRAVRNDKDDYKEERLRKLPYMHSYVDGNASRRIAEHLGFYRI